jgi:hypothetical protein
MTYHLFLDLVLVLVAIELKKFYKYLISIFILIYFIYNIYLEKLMDFRLKILILIHFCYYIYLLLIFIYQNFLFILIKTQTRKKYKRDIRNVEAHDFSKQCTCYLSRWRICMP